MRKTEKITSRDNARLIHARKVRDGKASGKIFIEGRRLVEEALDSQHLVIRECFVADDFYDKTFLDAVATRVHDVVEISEQLFRSIADTVTPQGIILIADRPVSSLLAIESALKNAELPIVIYLIEINNPSNLGAIMRTSEAAGIPGVIVSKNGADVYSSKSVRASMGAAFRVPTFVNADFEEIVRWAKREKLTITASEASASESYAEIDWKIPRLLIFGSEAHGLGEGHITAIEQSVHIPMDNGVESLNLAVSAGIILFEAKRQVLRKPAI